MIGGARELGVALLGAAIIPALTAAQETAERPIALTNVTVFDGTGAPAMPGMTIVLRGAIIASVEPSEGAHLPPDAVVHDLTGRYVIPGLIDAHVHMPESLGPYERLERVLPFLKEKLEAGITTVRDMGGDARFSSDTSREKHRAAASLRPTSITPPHSGVRGSSARSHPLLATPPDSRPT